MVQRKGMIELYAIPRCDHKPLLARFLPSILVEPTCEQLSYEMQISSLISVYKSRVCEVVLNGDKTFSLRQQKYRVTESLKTGEATVLFGAERYSLSHRLHTYRLHTFHST